MKNQKIVLKKCQQQYRNIKKQKQKIYKTKEWSNKIKIKKALISVFDKTNILGISKFLINNNVEIYSSGGTYKFLKENNIKVNEISKYTNSPEILDGRIKTLHPKIYGGILANRNVPKHLRELKKNKINLINLVIVNLYPFKKTLLFL